MGDADMEIIIRIYDRERLLEAKLQSGETCTIGKAAGCTIQLAAACLGKSDHGQNGRG